MSKIQVNVDALAARRLRRLAKKHGLTTKSVAELAVELAVGHDHIRHLDTAAGELACRLKAMMSVCFPWMDSARAIERTIGRATMDPRIAALLERARFAMTGTGHAVAAASDAAAASSDVLPPETTASLAAELGPSDGGVAR